MSRSRGVVFMLLCSMTGACGGGEAVACDEDMDCPSGFCRADRTCGPDNDGGMTEDAPNDGATGLCTPNHDGMIALAELPLAPGKMATFRVATDPTFDTAGSSAGGGMRQWDLSIQLANDNDRS